MPATEKSTPSRPLLLLTLLVAMLIIVLSVTSGEELEALTEEMPVTTDSALSASSSALANCRYGVTLSSHRASIDMIEDVGAGVFYRFNTPYWGVGFDDRIERALMIRIKQRKDNGVYLPAYWSEVPLDQELADFIRANRGALWLLGNEIERGPNPDKTGTPQGDIYPEMYARAYHDIYYFIKGIDPSARIAIAGLIQATPSRLQYLDRLWFAYKEIYSREMPIDVWNIHLYVLPEVTPEGEPNGIANIALGTDKSLGKRESGRDASLCSDPDVYCYAEHDDVSIIAEQLVAIRTWMKEHGQQNKPLIVSEFSTLFHLKYEEDESCMGIKDEYGNCFTRERVAQYLVNAFNYFNDARDENLGYPLDNDRLVQQWIWYDSAWDVSTSSLLELNSNELTAIGQAFHDYVHAEQPAVNFIVESTTVEASHNADDTYDARLKANFRNNGSVVAGEPFLVSFYSDQAMTQLIGSTAVSASVRGCATASYSAAVDWRGLPEGTYQYWAKVDSLNTIREAAESDNVITGTVIADPSIPIYSLDLQIDTPIPGVGGSVSRDPDASKYGTDQRVELTAVPFTGWKFLNWSGDISGTDPTATVIMNSDKTIRAQFAPIPYQVNTTVTGSGTVQVSPEKENYIYGETVSLQAVPVPGWRFANWSGAVEGARPLVEIKLQDDVDLAANFSQILPFVTDQAYLPLSAGE